MALYGRQQQRGERRTRAFREHRGEHESVGLTDGDRTSIKDWPEGERPRERMIARGPDALSDAELLAVLIRTGTAGRNALDLARTLLDTFGSLRALARRKLPELHRIKGVGMSRAVAIMAAFELGRRSAAQPDAGADAIIRCSDDIATRYIPRLRDLTTERFIAVLLDNAGRILREYEISRGTVDASLAAPREVFHAAVLELASGVILVHNHPSGITRPSDDDIQLTRGMVDAGRLMGIPVYDHVIVCGNTFFSFADEGMLR